MNEIEFNLLYEPWIRVLDGSCAIKEVSVREALVNAHKYSCLSGELKTQDAAVFRFLLSVLHSVFERFDCEGNDSPIVDEETAILRWQELWDLRKFPDQPLISYFESQKENFFLFHPSRPFYQVPSAICGTEYESSKLNGNLSESSNKLRLFQERTGSKKRLLSYSEAARWLIYVNAYDDTSAKATKEFKSRKTADTVSPGAGWLGKIGYVQLTGDNLFETLMLNFVLLDDNNEHWNSCVPVWENETVRSEERTPIAIPYDQAMLLSLQSRRIALKRCDDSVNGFYLLGGDFFSKENAFSEQMTIWSDVKDKKTKSITGYLPQRHDKSKQMWRSFSVYTETESGGHIPGVIRWYRYLLEQTVITTDRMIQLQVSAVIYGEQDYFASDQFSDSLSIHSSLLSVLGREKRILVINEISRCDKIADYISDLASELFLSSGGDPEKIKAKVKPVSQSAKERFFFNIDIPFRKWLSDLTADETNEVSQIKRNEWRTEADRIARELAAELVSEAGPSAFVGKKINDRYITSSTAENKFHYRMNRLKEE